MKNVSKTRACLVLLAVTSLTACKGEERSPTPDASGRPGASQDADSPDMSSPFDPGRPPDRLALPKERILSGEWGTKEDYRMRVVAVRECEVESYFAPREGHLKLGVEVELSGASDKDVPSNPLHASLVDSEGQRYEATLAGCRPSLSPLRIKRGESARGFITFELPKTATGLVLRYEPFIVGRADTTLAFELGR